MDDLINFFSVASNLGSLLSNFFTTLFNAIWHGIVFIINAFTVIPNFLMHDFFPNLPSFFQNCLYGVLGFMIFVLITKIILLIKG